MYLTSLELESFRNYRQLKLDVDKGTHIFYGANAQGKTNLLEAIYLCTCARSHRTGRDEELIRNGDDHYTVKVTFLTDRGLAESVRFSYYDLSADGRHRARRMFYNDIEIDRVADMMGIFHAVIFAPEDLQIVKGGPGARRRFLDILISRTHRAYFRSLQDYTRLLLQRNRLLKQIREGSHTRIDPLAAGATEDPFSPAMQLMPWDESLAEAAAAILYQRLRYTERIREVAGLALRQLTAAGEQVDIRYRGTGGLTPEMTEGDIKSLIKRKLSRAASEDILRGSTSLGPHRDDLDLTLNGLDVRSYASQGQQRSLVLSLKIAELLILFEKTGEKPILLLDDVMSELDLSRRRRLLEIIRGHQVFMTGTDREHMFPILREMEGEGRDEAAGGAPVFYHVKNGHVTRDLTV